MTRVTPNQSYLVKQMQWKLAAAFASGLMRAQGANITDAHTEKPWEDPNKVLWWPTAWRKDHQLFKTRLHDNVRGLHASMIHFSAARWDSQNSDLQYGEKSIDQRVNERDATKTKIVRNQTDSPIHVAYEEAVELTNSFSSSITKGVTLDMTKEAGVDTSVTVGAEYAGVSAEASVSAHFGVSQSKSESSEQGKEESEEGTTSESLAIDFEAAPRSAYLIEIDKLNQRTSQPFDINGIMDFDVGLTYFSKQADGEHSWTRAFRGVDELLQYVHGYNTAYPMMGFWEKASRQVQAAILFIAEPENRRIQVSGIAHASLDSNADYDVELLGDHIPDGLSHLPVVDARDV